MYSAQICRITTQTHPNADRLKIGVVAGYTVVVSINTVDNDLGIFFSSDGQLSEEFAIANDLVSYTDENGKRQGGFFDKRRRVRVQTFRGVKSEGFWIPISSLASFGDISSLAEGDKLDTFNGIPLCNKYYTPATLKTSNTSQTKTLRKNNTFFAKHFDTAQFRDNICNLKKGDLLSVTVKYHGTSQRVGYIPTERKLSFWEKVKGLFSSSYTEYDIFVGTRNCILTNPSDEILFSNAPFKEKYRHLHASKFKSLLRENEVVYYELVGYGDCNKTIMPSHHIETTKSEDDKAIVKRYGNDIDFIFGCSPGTCREFVYRITNVSPDGTVFDLSDQMMRKRCSELGLEPVDYLIEPFIFNGDQEKLKNMILRDEILEGTVDGSMKEGSVIRIDNENGVSFQKVKNFSFAYLEGIQKTFDGYVDTEEIS